MYQSGEYYLPELVCAADAMKAALEIFTLSFHNSLTDNFATKGHIIIATVQEQKKIA
ncbi:MAG TPA: B12-binding domain-containing protein [Anaerovoracaceae bacterium]|nr:B12-binding domain-containing protein [Anaerovoracaceae bacterium]